MGTVAENPPLSPRLFNGRYEIDRELGRGGTAIVYLAHDRQKNETVALKVLREALAGSGAAKRFLEELEFHQRLNHPNILPVLDSGSWEEQLFLVLPYLDGGTLRARLATEKLLPLPNVVAITRSIADALSHVHTNGLVHRDVKPENILFKNDHAVLGDFGIARALERAMGDTTTSTNVIRGTPLYMSPEQAAGERSLDARTDVYSLGCVAYEMLAGMHPFAGPTVESMMSQRLSFPPRPLRAYRPSLPASVERVVLRALVVSRVDRFQTASEFADALPGDPRRVAVLYFDDHTPDKSIGHVAAGLTENLIDQLSQVPALRVTSANRVRAFRADGALTDSIARQLGVGTIIAGSVSSFGPQLRATVRLIVDDTRRRLKVKRACPTPLSGLLEKAFA